MRNQRRTAAIAGISLLAMAVIAGLGYGYAFGQLYVAHNASATQDKLNQSPGLLQLVIVSFSIILVLDVIVAGTLYVLFQKVSRLLSLISSGLRLLYAVILGRAICYLLPLFYAREAAATMDHLDSFLSAWSLGLVIFGGHLFLLGILLKQSGFVPKLIVMFALFAGLCYTLTNSANLLYPPYEQYRDTIDRILALPMALGELALAVWLIRSSRKQKGVFN